MSMNQEEQEDFLRKTECIAKLSTLNKDGTIHIVPVWYVYDGKNYIITSDSNSHHVRNIKRRKNVTVLIDTVQFPTKGVRIKGSATIEGDEGLVHEYELQITQRYIRDKRKAEDYVRKREIKSKRIAIIVTPKMVSSWDFSKDKEEIDFFKDHPVYSLYSGPD